MTTMDKLDKTIPKGWEVKKFRDLLDYERPDEYIVKSTDYSESVGTPVLTANKSFVLGYTDENFGIYKDVPAIIFDDFTTDSKYVDFPFKIKSSAIKILKNKDQNSDLKFLYEKIKSIKFPVSNHQRYYISQYQELEIVLPKKDEQRKIVEILESVDSEIEKTDHVIAATEKLKKGLMQQLFTRGIGHTKFKKTEIGEIPEQWSVKKVSDLFEIGRGRVISKIEIQKNPGPYPVFSSQTSNNGEFGRMGTYDFEGEYLTWTTDGIYAGAVFYRNGKFNCTNVCGTLKQKVDMDIRFFSYLLPRCAERHVVKTANPKLMNNVMANVSMPAPHIKEQKEIAEILFSVGKKISINRDLKEKLNLLKKGLMQDLLSGRVRM